MNLTILIAATNQWFSPARLAIRLAKAGCRVEAVCLKQSPLFHIRSVNRAHVFHGLAPVRSLRAAIVRAKPDLIIPGDDNAVLYLHSLFAEELKHGLSEGQICSAIERSLGASSCFSLVYARTKLMETAASEGIRVPATKVISDVTDLCNWANQIGFPMVLKADGTSGGDGVRIVNTLEAAERAFETLQAAPLLAKAFKRALFNRDSSLLVPSLRRRKFVVNAQKFVSGREATSAVACWEGNVLADLHFEVVKRQEERGPSTVLRVIENLEMRAAGEKIARKFHLSGVIGFDFMLEGNTERAWLLELNPRAPQVGHLSLGQGHDIPAALIAAVTGQEIECSPKAIDKEIIALFPGEWIRDPNSCFLRHEYHDVPWEEPSLVKIALNRFTNEKPWYSLQKWVDLLSQKLKSRA